MQPLYWPDTSQTPTMATTAISLPEWKMETYSSSKLTSQNQEKQPNTTPQEKDTENNKGDKVEREEEEDKARCEWDFNLSTIVSSKTSCTACDTLGVVEIDPGNTLLATGGIARKMRIYTSSKLFQQHGQSKVSYLEHGSACDVCMCTPAKLSSLKWKPESGSRVIGSGDYDGVVTEYDLEQRLSVFERDEHGGHKVRSVDYTHFNPAIGASGSDDGTMQMWDTRCEGGACISKVVPASVCSAVCCVEFDPFGSSLVIAGCADKRAYGYDVRKVSEPVLVFEGHKRTVTYVRFLNARTVVTAATDGCLKQWRVDDTSVVRTYRGHVNSKNFTGLSVGQTCGLLGCGSENNQVFVYDKRWGEPIWVHGFGLGGEGGSKSGFVSSVCWREVGEDECNLVAGGSDGVLQVLTGKKKPFYLSLE